jgi:hypothetical protein
MAKTQFITIINATSIEVDGNLIIRGTLLNDALANKKHCATFQNGVTIASNDGAGTFGPVITNASADEITHIDSRIKTYNRPSFHMTFVDDRLTHVSVRETA